MESRITIEVDFENGNQPVIQIISRSSDDVRDKLIKSFYQQLGGSSWCRIVFDGLVSAIPGETASKRITISPIPEESLKEEGEIMIGQARVREVFDKQNKPK